MLASPCAVPRALRCCVVSTRIPRAFQRAMCRCLEMCRLLRRWFLPIIAVVIMASGISAMKFFRSTVFPNGLVPRIRIVAFFRVLNAMHTAVPTIIFSWIMVLNPIPNPKVRAFFPAMLKRVWMNRLPRRLSRATALPNLYARVAMIPLCSRFLIWNHTRRIPGH